MSAIVDAFLAEVKATQMIWALHDKETDGWVIVDSVNYEETDTILLWSTESSAQKACTDEWESYVPTQISVADWLEFWFEDLNEDGVIVGIDWQGGDDLAEVELGEFTQQIADIEQL